MKKAILVKVILVLMLVLILPAQASPIEDISGFLQKVVPNPKATPPLQPSGTPGAIATYTTVPVSQISDQPEIMTRLYTLNTPTNIQYLNKELSVRNLSSIKVNIITPQTYFSFYVVKDVGITSVWANQDAEVTVSKVQINKAFSILQKGDPSWYDRWQLWYIWKFG